MEIVSGSMLEFGDFESSTSFFSNDKCVELPASWQLHSCRHFLDSTSNNQNVCDKAISPKSYQGKDTTQSFSIDCDPKLEIECVSSSQNIAPETTTLVAQKEAGVDEKVISFNQISDEQKIKDAVLEVKSSPAINDYVKSVTATTQKENKEIEIEELSVTNGSVSTEEKPALKAVSGWANLFRHKSSHSSSINAKLVNGESLIEDKLPKEPKKATQSSILVTADTTTPLTENHCSSKKSMSSTITIKVEDDPNAKVLAQALEKLELKFKPQAFIPRGLINSSNWCYINATLQALLMCPPFFQLLKSLPKPCRNQQTSTPVLDCFIDLASEFYPLSTKKGYQLSKEIRQGPPFTPDCVYKMLTSTNSSLSENGSQEDTEEFLSCVLNGLHEEMCSLGHLINGESKDAFKKNENDLSKVKLDGSHNKSDGEEWEEVIGTKRNKSAVTRRADHSKTLISQIFRGELCTTVTRSGQKLSISHEPFYSLPLTFSGHEQYWSVEDALYALTDRESFSGNESNQNITRQQFIEVLPPILILHLKRFVYNKNGGLKKIDRRMDFRSDLIIARDLLSKTSRKYSLAQRTYKLFAVVCHHGERATGGHYTADVFHIGMSSWLRIDDQNIQTVSHSEVTRHSSTRSPYLLFYRRTDLG